MHITMIALLEILAMVSDISKKLWSRGDDGERSRRVKSAERVEGKVKCCERQRTNNFSSSGLTLHEMDRSFDQDGETNACTNALRCGGAISCSNQMQYLRLKTHSPRKRSDVLCRYTRPPPFHLPSWHLHSPRASTSLACPPSRPISSRIRSLDPTAVPQASA